MGIEQVMKYSGHDYKDFNGDNQQKGPRGIQYWAKTKLVV
jgi:hypothetical protein